MDCTKAGACVEIDAVEMVGRRYNFGKTYMLLHGRKLIVDRHSHEP